MREKLQKLMASEQLTSSRFAELLGIQPSGVTHLLGGRNKPSFDLVQKILRRFPRINPDWLLLDSEQMYRPETEESQTLLNQAENITCDRKKHSECSLPISAFMFEMGGYRLQGICQKGKNAEIKHHVSPMPNDRDYIGTAKTDHGDGKRRQNGSKGNDTNDFSELFHI